MTTQFPQKTDVQVSMPRALEHTHGPVLWPSRSAHANKGTFGHVVIIAGHAQAPGAGILAVRGALRAGCGLVTWAVSDHDTVLRAHNLPPEAMLCVRAAHESIEAWIMRAMHGATAVVIGPGLSQAPSAAAVLRAALKDCAVPVCLDADALNLLAASPELWALQPIDEGTSVPAVPWVITPHPKELSRLLRCSVDDVQGDRKGAVQRIATQHHVVAVLKGAGTLIAEPRGALTELRAGNVGMATGGTGDVLAGIIGSFLAQWPGLMASVAAPIDASTDSLTQDAACPWRLAYDAVCVGALLHSAAGDVAAQSWGHAGMIASDVVEAMGVVIRGWQR